MLGIQDQLILTFPDESELRTRIWFRDKEQTTEFVEDFQAIPGTASLYRHVLRSYHSLERAASPE